ncbi:MAG: hypothetical protein EXS03_07820 [Phycisphaerales bacterium]|nr:hypothetical protein [Phycisphaerales bacterium]
MCAAATLYIAFCTTIGGATAGDTVCPGLDAQHATVAERRAALDECAKAAGKTPLDYLLAEVASLTPRDPRTSQFGMLVEGWPIEELAAHTTHLLAVATSEQGANDASRIVAIRALLALPPDRRPPEATRFEPLVIEMSAVPSRMTYDKKEFSAAPGQVVRIKFHNADALEHNLLIVAPGAMAEMGVAGDRMGQTADGKLKEFVPDSPKVLAVMGIVAPGASQDFWFIAPSKPGTYPYVCTYPQHWRMMNGKLKVVQPAGAPTTVHTTTPAIPATDPR